MLRYLRTYWFLICLAVVLIVSHWGSSQLRFLADEPRLRSGIVFSVMFLMALPVPLRHVGDSLRKPGPSLLAIAINQLGLPLMAYFVSRWLTAELGGGLIVSSVIPCTLASAAVMVRKAGGNDTIPVMVTLITTLFCFLVTPAWLWLFLAKTVHLDGWQTAWNLGWEVLFPIVLAQVVALIAPVGSWAQKYKNWLGTICQMGILAMVAIGSIQLGNRGDLNRATGALVWVGVAAAGIHLAALTLGWFMAAGLGWDRSTRIGVALASSQKTLMVGLKIAVDAGVSIVPIVAYHILQLVIDAALVETWGKGSKATNLAVSKDVHAQAENAEKDR